MKKYSFTYTLIGLITVIGLLLSCKKEYETAPTPYNEITSFKVAYLNGQDSIDAILDGETIHIVWPGSAEWPMPVTLKPKITVAANATVFPTSDSDIALEDGAIFTVTAQDGSAKKYTLKVTNGAVLPRFVDEDVVSLRIGQAGFVSLLYLAADGSDSLILVNDAQQEFKVIQIRQLAVTGISFIADQPDGSGIPAGEYYVKILNKYQVPVLSSTKRVTITDGPPMPYVHFNHTQTMEVKPGGTLTFPIRYFSAAHGINLARFLYMDPASGVPTHVTLSYTGTNETHDKVSFTVPADAPVGIVMGTLDGGLLTRITYEGVNLHTPRSAYYPYAIKIVE